MNNPDGLDEIGQWSVDKLRILQAYSKEYAAILSNQRTNTGARLFKTGYIDGFAGAGKHLHKSSREEIPGSPAIALATPGFDEFHFVDLDDARVGQLQALCRGHANAHVYSGDCNAILLDTIFPKFPFKQYRRALCFIDPYGMHVDWKVLEAAGKSGSIEIFLNFPVADINRNAKRARLEDISPDGRARMTRLWGNEDWHAVMFKPSPQMAFDLGGGAMTETEKTGNDTLVEAFRERLKTVAGFKFVPHPVAMKNSIGAIVYYLFFAGHNETGERIAKHIMKKYRR
ncbi:MAG TPA: three-Cys-motif partner protein TcmP [Candidatus Didemnitutus sp.]|nr:three-Cys-motif partner protein TcmP [Candidatus Didemnitutus sp.]